jgi:hypothetical protein
MASKTKPNVVSLFRRDHGDHGTEELALDVAAKTPETTAATPEPVSPIDLAGKPKLLFAMGLGGVGKTTLLRWIAERGAEREGTILATVDPINRTLARYFPDVVQPDTKDAVGVTRWLEAFIGIVMDNKMNAVVDFGGGDTSLSRLLAEAPDLQALIESAGVEPVALYLMSPREEDLTPMAQMTAAGFAPKTTALILNKGRVADPTVPPEPEFARVMAHSAFQAAKARCAATIWMPRLYSAKVIEERRILFGQARDGVLPPGRSGEGLGPFDRSRTRHWLAEMEEAFAPIASWLP